MVVSRVPCCMTTAFSPTWVASTGTLERPLFPWWKDMDGRSKLLKHAKCNNCDNCAKDKSDAVTAPNIVPAHSPCHAVYPVHGMPPCLENAWPSLWLPESVQGSNLLISPAVLSSLLDWSIVRRVRPCFRALAIRMCLLFTVTGFKAFVVAVWQLENIRYIRKRFTWEGRKIVNALKCGCYKR